MKSDHKNFLHLIGLYTNRSTPFLTPTKCTVIISTVLKKHLQYVSVQVYQLRGEKMHFILPEVGTLLPKYFEEAV